VEAVPNRENADERSQRLTTARLLLHIVGPLDEKLSQRLVAILSHDAEQATDADRLANADGLVEAAMALVDKDPPRAAALGALALRVGRSTQIVWLVSTLLSKDPVLGNALFAQTLAVARQSLDRELIASLTQIIFPESVQPGTGIRELPDNLRTELLKLDVVYLQANPITEENRNSNCNAIASFIFPVLVHFDRLLPQQAAFARQSINQCQSLSPFVRQRVDDARRDQPLNTVDDLLKAADDAEDSKVRTVYLYRAAALAKEQKDFDRALKILDSMNTESREFMGESWVAYRWDWATLSALRHNNSGDVYGMRLIMNAVPADLKPFAKIAFVARLPDLRDKDNDPTLEFLNDARTGLPRSALSDAEKADAYFALLPLAIKFQPVEATAILKEAVAALNRAAQAKDKAAGNNDGSSLSGSEFVKTLPASLLEMDEYVVKEAVASISSANTRVQVRLELLSVCLEQMRISKRTTPNKRRTAQ
jgi:hypothetical protein